MSLGLERLPPYLTYSAWLRLLQALESYLPPRIDKSYFSDLKFSNSARLTARGTLLFLGLITVKEEPTDKLKQLLQASGDERKNVLRAVIEQSYRPVLRDLELERTTLGQLSDRFEESGAKRDIGRKCVSFFLALASDAGIPLSPPLAAKLRIGGRVRATGAHRPLKRAEERAAKTLAAGASAVEKEVPSYDELRRLYILRLIQEVRPVPVDVTGKDAAAIKAAAEMRNAELDRIERLLDTGS